VTSLLPALLGLALGVRHAFEPDHLAAVSTLASEQKGVRSALGLGLCWGIGHALTLLVFGGALALLEVRLSPSVANGLELFVALVLVGLGIRAVKRAIANRPVTARHTHFRWFGLTLGVMHGLAGTGALVALVLLELPDFSQRICYLAFFGAGATASMAGLTALVGIPLGRVARARQHLLGFSGALSVAVGLFMINQMVD
jgi:hypothetical protein